MHVRKFLLVCIMVSLPVIASACATAKVEKATEAAAGKTAALNSAKAIRLDILKDSGTKALTMDQIGSLDSCILELARNEIYARHGTCLNARICGTILRLSPGIMKTPFTRIS